ncbi:MAG: MBL fold metallo-hydrolase [Alphaproteobacteria bacterium]|nr:MBL fold metallo-hydrolase [Alphaproteobacteria bacterium]
MTKVIILGSGAAPGVPAIAKGWGACNPNNEKNRRKRIGTYIQIGSQKILIDTSPDLRAQLLENNIKHIDAVLYTHAHADHLHGIDDLREFNRLTKKPIDIYGSSHSIEQIKTRFSYLICHGECADKGIFKASLDAHVLGFDEDFYLNDVKINLLELSGHLVPSNGYLFNDGEIVYISDCREICDKALAKIKRRPKLLILPLTTINSNYAKCSHMGLDKVLEYVNVIGPELAVINHMAVECDYDEVNSLTPSNVVPAYDNMVIEF